MITFIKYLFLLVGLFQFNLYYSQNQEKYDINDPRNPNCPCHKYQKIADEEYKTLLASVNKNKQSVIVTNNKSEKEASEKTNNSLTEKDKIKKENRAKLLFHKKRKKGKKHSRFQCVFTGKHWNFLKRKRSTDSCFNW